MMAYVRGSTRELCIVADRVADQGSLVEKDVYKRQVRHLAAKTRDASGMMARLAAQTTEKAVSYTHLSGSLSSCFW